MAGIKRHTKEMNKTYDRLFGQREVKMKKYLVLVLLLVLVLFLTPLVRAQEKKAADTQADKILKKIDELYRSTSSIATFEMEITTPHWKRALKIDAWTLGMETSFFRILSPKREKGMATLKVGNEMWNFLPRTNKVIKIPPSMMMGSWMGSDFTNDDLVKEYTFFDDYTFEMTTVENPEKGILYLKCIPKEGRPIVWGAVVIAVEEDGYLPVWQKYYGEKGKLMREMFFKEVKQFGKRKIPSVLELVPTHKKGHKTIVRYVEAQFDVKVDKDIFSLRNLRKRI
jgi:outer membrane lipoprotein-sorting protein